MSAITARHSNTHYKSYTTTALNRLSQMIWLHKRPDHRKPANWLSNYRIRYLFIE